MKKHLKSILGLVVVVATIAAFIWYISNHPELIDQLKDVKPWTLAALLLLYAIWFGALAVILQISVRMFSKTLSFQENVLVSAYSSLINFFGPGQSGPGLRGIYLKKKHGMRIKDYIFATLLYYACYAVISAFMMFAGSVAWWQTALLVIAASTASMAAIRIYLRRSKIKERPALFKYLGWMFGATVLQLAAQATIYAIEVRSIDAHIGFGQIISYTGAANFALFAALTPGAIGIREAFLLFTQNIHNIGGSVIIAANVIDRAVYITFLGILFVLVFGLHANKKFKLRQLTHEDEPANG